MGDLLLLPYEDPASHAAVSEIIRRRSVNRQDVRQAVLEGLDLSSARRVLDLGCGFGFMSEAIAARCAPEACVTGVDAWEANREPFRRQLASTQRGVRFVRMKVGDKLPWPDASYDLVVCSYSLYFFPRIIPEIERILAPSGLLLAVTHSEGSYAGLLRAIAHGGTGSGSVPLVARFSAENAPDRLHRHFRAVSSVSYPNRLRFGAEHREELLAFVRFKLPVLMADVGPGMVVPPAVLRALDRWMSRHGELQIEKDDACFRCWASRRTSEEATADAVGRRWLAPRSAAQRT